MTRLLIFTPTIGDQMRPEMIASIEAQQTDIPYIWEVGYHNPFPGEKMRNVVAQYQRAQEIMLAGDYDAMLTVEDDMILPPDAVQRLYATDAPVVYAVYLLRHGPHALNAWQHINDRNLGMTLSLYPAEVRRYREQGWAKVCGVGWGCTLIRRPVLERIKIHSNGDTDAGDLTFATDCLRAGFEQIARFDVPCGHITDEGKVLEVYEMGGILSRVYALKDVIVSVDNQSTPLKANTYYTLPPDLAKELERGGYVRITNEPEAANETTEAPTGKETAVAPQQRKVKRS